MRCFGVAILVLLAMVATSCLAIEHHRKALKDETSHEIYQRKLTESSTDDTVSNHHYIPRQNYGNGGGSSDDASIENHHYIPRQDFNNNGGYTGDAANNDINP
ncbi:hypothetical protein HanIR_Chr01g0033941 [Helianthus annuus]|nr:hypothetical protein HanIR_Chr01g0033941 [Helianthus annuus]